MIIEHTKTWHSHFLFFGCSVTHFLYFWCIELQVVNKFVFNNVFQGASKTNEELWKWLAEVETKVVQSNGIISERISDLEMKIQSNKFEKRLRKVEKRVKMNDEVMERLQILEQKMDSILMASNEKVTKVFKCFRV